MKKTIIVVVALAVIFSLNITLAAKGGDPLAVVWAAIADLQNQIDNIQLVTGPQGEQGIQGPKGDPGEPSWDEQRIASLEARVEALENPSIAECSASTVCGETCTQGSLTYGTVLGADGKCWLDRNLGATQAATAYNDSASYGWIFQWGRGADGHQIPTSIVTTTTSSTDTPGHSMFITNTSAPYDWRVPQNDNFWQGVNGINNPCPSSFHIPTQQEWNTLISSAGITNINTAFNSSLRLTAAGYRGPSSAHYEAQGGVGHYYSSSTDDYGGVYNFSFDSTIAGIGSYLRATGFSVRCLR